MPDGTVPAVRVGEVDLAIRETGEGFPVVLVHGFTGSKEDWLFVAPALARDFRPISYDQRGHGESSKPSGRHSYSFEVLAGDLAALLDALHIERCHLVGHSLGGVVVQRYLIAHGTSRVERVVLTDSTYVGSRSRELEDRSRAAEQGGMAAVLAADQAEQAPNPALEAMPEVAKFMRDRLLGMSPDAFCSLADEMIGMEDIRPLLGAVEVPVLVVCGANDKRTPPPVNRALARAFPRGRYAEVAYAAHTPQFENVGGWLAEVVPFLRGDDQQV